MSRTTLTIRLLTPLPQTGHPECPYGTTDALVEYGTFPSGPVSYDTVPRENTNESKGETYDEPLL